MSMRYGKHNKKKGEVGEANRYISRNRAIKKLQLDLPSFNRLCIIKGLFPIEPKNRIKAQRGDSKYRPLYFKKDIRFLMHDPLIWTIRDEQTSAKRLAKARHLKDHERIKTLKRNKPQYRLDQHVLERYPTFLHAIRDLADPLTMIFLFSSIKARSPIKEHHMMRCQQLKTEFLTYVIEGHCLTRAFIATRGYYYEAEIMGHRVVWTVPHNCVTFVPSNADMRIMRHFLEFNIAMLGFVMFRLMPKVNLRYPLVPAVIPKLAGPDNRDRDKIRDMLVSLNCPLRLTVGTAAEVEKDKEDEELTTAVDSYLLAGSTKRSKKAYTESLEGVERRQLFRGLKFFIGIENNRESLTFVIRSCGGEVSWMSTVFPCSTFTEDDQTVTHQIVDRPNFDNKYITRYYIQPQWVYDSLNSCTRQNVQPYFPGSELPPHICPFLKEYEGWYVPPEEENMRKLLAADPAEKQRILKRMTQEEQDKINILLARETETLSSDEESDGDDDLENDEDEDEDEDDGFEEEAGDDDKAKNDEAGAQKRKTDWQDYTSEKYYGMDVDEHAALPQERAKEDEENDEDMEEQVVEKKQPKEEKSVEVRPGKPRRVIENVERKNELANDYKMRAFMIHKKNRTLYNKLKEKEHRQHKRSTYLKERREQIEIEKFGNIPKEDIKMPRKAKPKRKNYAERKKEGYKQRVTAAVKFAKSKRNPHRDAKPATNN